MQNKLVPNRHGTNLNRKGIIGVLSMNVLTGKSGHKKTQAQEFLEGRMVSSLKKENIAFLLLVIPLFWSAEAYADYFVTGPVQGFFCKGFVVEACSKKQINRVEKDGGMYELKRVYKNVDEYKSKINYCHIRIKEGSAVSFLKKNPVFYFFDERLGTPDSIGFPCVRR